ncbi:MULTISPECIES: hypothetical protein [Yersinia]|nr:MULTISPECIES: hypothetical protein [Yersinia]MDA5545774.1 hypothetical protein [Yersinia rochesterensis]MDN0108718.1 hypothetical protein [Yersinia rochesterensis]CNH10543.1 putative NTP-binding protein [Yersinia kristensenii]
MQRHNCIEILKQLKLTAMASSFDEVVIDSNVQSVIGVTFVYQ